MDEHRVELQFLPLGDLLASTSTRNPKRHATGAIGRSIARFGMVGVPLRSADGETFVGKGRLIALQDRWTRGEAPPRGIQVAPDGTWLVPTLVGFDLDEIEAAAYRLADNQLPAVGGWDEVALTAQLRELSELSSWRLDGTGFTTVDLEQLLAKWELPASAETMPDDVPALPDAADLYVRPGELWQLGRHRVLAGDATERDSWDRLLDGRHAQMAFLDPPYNVDLGRHSGASGSSRRSILNDNLAPEEWELFVQRWAEHLVARVDGALYVCMSTKEWPVVARVLEDAGGHWSDTLIWDKGEFTLGRADFQRGYEVIWYGWREGSRHQWHGGRAQSNVLRFPRPVRNELHPTQKPLALIEHVIALSSRQGDVVLDPFLGSGSTIAAAERTGRECLGMELDPRYVQVAIERWQRLTGDVAIKLAG